MSWDDEDDEEGFLPDAFLAEIDNLVAQHNQQSSKNQLTQPESPSARPASAPGDAAVLGAGVGEARPAGAPAGPLHQPSAAPPPLQLPAGPPWQYAGPQQAGRPPLLGSHRTPALPTPGLPPAQPPNRPATAGLQLQPLPAVPGLASGNAAGTGLPMGRVSQAAAEMRAQPAAAGGGPQGAAAPPGLQQLVAQLQQERDRLQQQLGSVEGTNKLLRSNLDQAERDRMGLRQRLQQLEAKAPAPGPQSSFTLVEMQKQLEALKQQLMFKEQELEELKRQQSDKLERLREAEMAVRGLQAQVQGAEQAKQQLESQLHRSLAERVQQQPDASPSVAEPQRGSSRQAQQQARASGHKRRQSAGEGTTSAVPRSSVAAAAGPAAAAAGGGGGGSVGPVLGPAVLAATQCPSSGGLVSRLWAVCGDSLGVLLGAGPPPAAAGLQQQGAAGSAVAQVALGGAFARHEGTGPTALLLRIQSKASAVAAHDGLASSFCQAFGQQLQQVASRQLPAAVLVDSIGAMAAAVVASCHQPGGGRARTPGKPPTGPAPRAGSTDLPQQQARLLAAGLQVMQHLLGQDDGCRQAAVASCLDESLARSAPTAAGGVACTSGPPGDGMASLMDQLQLSSRVRLSRPDGAPQQQGALAPCVPATPPLPSCHAALRQHASAFAGTGQGLAGIFVAAGLLAGRQQHPQVLGAALGALCALAAGIPPGSREVLRPVLETGTMQQFLRPPGLRLWALQLLHLLLDSPVLAEAFEQSLALAGAAAQGGETPGRSAGTGGTDGGTGGESGGKEAAGGGAQEGAEPMQVDGGWVGAPAVLRHVLQSIALQPAASPQRQRQQQESPPPPQQRSPRQQPAAHQSEAAHLRGQQSLPGQEPAMPAPVAAPEGGSSWEGSQYAIPRQALSLVAMLREQGVRGILSHLIQSDDGGGGTAGGEGLCQRLVQLLEAASAQQGPQAATAPLSPAQCPPALLDAAASGGASSTAEAAEAQRAWQQRLRLMQEALTLLRGLLVDEALGSQALEELCSPPSTARLSLTTLGRITRLEPPGSAPPTAGPLASSPLPLAPWAQAIGSSSAAAGASINAGTGPLACCSVEDVAYMARSMRHRVLHRLKAAQQ